MNQPLHPSLHSPPAIQVPQNQIPASQPLPATDVPILATSGSVALCATQVTEPALAVPPVASSALDASSATQSIAPTPTPTPTPVAISPDSPVPVSTAVTAPTPVTVASTSAGPLDHDHIPTPDEVRARYEEMPSTASKTWFVVTRGRLPGVYATWMETSPLVIGVSCAVFNRWSTKEEALAVYGAAWASGNVTRL